MARDRDDSIPGGAPASSTGPSAAPPFVRRAVDARGVVTLTLDRPACIQRAEHGHARRAAVRARSHRCRRRRAGRDPRRRRQGLLGRPRPEGDASRAVAGLLRGLVRAMRAGHADDPAPAGPGDRARPRHRDGGRLPARRGLRSGGGGRHRPLRGQRRQPRPLLLVAERRAVAQRRPQGRVRDAGDRAPSSRPRKPGRKVWSTGWSAPTRSMPRSTRWSARSSRSRGSRSRWARRCSIASSSAASKPAYEDAGRTMACNMMDDSALEGVQAFIEKRPPELEHLTRTDFVRPSRHARGRVRSEQPAAAPAARCHRFGSRHTTSLTTD